MYNYLGWIGSILLALCGLGPTIEALYTKQCTVPWSLLIPWYLGEILVLIPVVKKIKSPYLIFNYGMNIVFITIMIYYKF